MDRLFTCFLLLLSLSGSFSKYVYITEEKHWNAAWDYCRTSYTSLAPVSNNKDLNKLQKMRNSQKLAWVGLQRISGTKNWIWTGGGQMEVAWAKTQPDNGDTDSNGYIDDNGLNDGKEADPRPFFCYSAIVVKEKKTWEEALEFCRERYNDLASVASVTEMLLIQRELKKQNATGPFWIGLRFLAGDWLWVDGQELRYEAWGGGGEPTCPAVQSAECAALQAMKWFNNDIISASFGTSSTGMLPNYVATDAWWTDVKFYAAAVNNSGGVWGAHSCKEKLNFICY